MCIRDSSWPPLKKSTIAMRPIRKGELAQTGLTRRSGTALGDRERGLLSPRENDEWKRIYSKTLSQLMLIMEPERAKSIAAATAWKKMKERGARTKKEVLGTRDALIMRVTDSIYNSLKPSKPGTRGYRPRKNQIYEQAGKTLRLGTEVEYAKFHNKTRPVIPENANEWASEATNMAFAAVAVHIADNVI